MIRKTPLFVALLCAFISLSSCVMEDTADLASLVAGTYIGTGSDAFSTKKNLRVEVVRKSDTEISIVPLDDNTTNSILSLSLVQDGNWVKQSAESQDVTFEAKISKNKVPITFTRSSLSETYEGKME